MIRVEHVQKWLSILRSPDYLKIENRLYTLNGNQPRLCVWGAACEAYRLDGNDLEWVKFECDDWRPVIGGRWHHSKIAPRTVVKWLYDSEPDPYCLIESGGVKTQKPVAQVNDAFNMSLPEIADNLERYWLRENS